MSAALVIAGIGLAAQLIGNDKASKKQAQALRADAAAAKENARLAKLKAQMEAENQQIQSRYVLASATADYASSGVSGGSVDAVMASSAANAEFDRLNILFGGSVLSNKNLADSRAAVRGANDIKEANMYNQLATGLQGASALSQYKSPSAPRAEHAAPYGIYSTPGDGRQ